MSSSEPSTEELNSQTVAFDPVTLDCPHCSTPTVVSQVQGDRCPNCNFEFTRFEAGQDTVVDEFYRVVTGAKYRCPVPDGGVIVVHR